MPSIEVCTWRTGVRSTWYGTTVAKAEPWNSFEPCLVTMLTTPPVARPYSAW